MTLADPMRLRRALPRLLAMAALLLLLVACGTRGETKTGSVVVDIDVSPNPPAVGHAELTITLRDDDGEPLSGADVTVEGTMSHAGMKSVIRDAAEVGDGEYHVNDFEFTMPGDWIMIVTGETSDGDDFEQHIDLKGVTGDGDGVEQHDAHDDDHDAPNDEPHDESEG